MRKYAWILVFALLLSACSAPQSFPRTPEEEQKTLSFISIEDTFFNGGIMQNYYRCAYDPEDRWSDEALQNMAASVELDYPIDTLEEINAFAWALYDIAMAAELFDESLKPYSAERYAEGIWHFKFSAETPYMTFYDGDEASFLISGEDGHIITLRTKVLYLDWSYSKDWVEYNGSDALPEGERRPLKAVTWDVKSYNEQDHAKDKHSKDDAYYDPEWQKITAGIGASYPLLEPEDITGWAWDFAEAAAEAGLIDARVYPWFANRYSDGIWELTFNGGTYQSPLIGKQLTMMISDTDGHVIHLEQDPMAQVLQEKTLTVLELTNDTFEGSVSYYFFDQFHTIEDVLEDEAAQGAVSGLGLEYPITEKEQIQQIVWGFYEYAVERGLFPSRLLPHDATRFADGILYIVYSEQAAPYSYYDGPVAQVLISCLDGHIIAMDQSNTGSSDAMKFYVSENRVLEPLFLKTISWYNVAYNEFKPNYVQQFPDHEVEELLDDPQIQEAVSQIEIDYPLDSAEKIESFALQIRDICTAQGMMNEKTEPDRAIHYSDGIWMIQFGVNYVFLSDADGHIIAIDHIN